MGKPVSQEFMDRVMQSVRMYLRDLPGLSKRYGGKEVFTPEELEFAIEMAVDRINAISPPTHYLITNIPFRQWLLRMTAINLMESRLMYLERETVIAQDPGGVAAEEVEWKSLSRRLRAERQDLQQEIQSGKAGELLGMYMNSTDGIPSVYGGG